MVFETIFLFVRIPRVHLCSNVIYLHHVFAFCGFFSFFLFFVGFCFVVQFLVSFLYAFEIAGTWVYYKDTTQTDASIKLSNEWPTSPFLSDYTSLDNVNQTSYFLKRLRISSTVFTAMIWVEKTYGKLTPAKAISVLGGTLFLIPNNGSLVLQSEDTNINATCCDTDDAAGYGNVIQSTMYNLTGNYGVELKIQHSNQSITSIVDIYILDCPPLPSFVIQDLLKELINNTKLDSYLNILNLGQFIINTCANYDTQGTIKYYATMTPHAEATSSFIENYSLLSDIRSLQCTNTTCTSHVYPTSYRYDSLGYDTYDIDCDISTSPTHLTLVQRVGLAEFNNLGRNLSTVLTASTIVRIVTNENENRMIFNSGPLSRQYTQTQTTAAIDGNDTICPTGVG